MKDKLKSGGNYRLQVWLSPYNGGRRCLVHLIRAERDILTCFGNMSMEDGIAFSNGFYSAQDAIIEELE